MSRAQGNRTQWDKLADWYAGWNAQEGSKFHRYVAMPLALEMLNLKSKESIIDLACGTGALAPLAKSKGADYTGVDSSPKMVNYARERHGQAGKFLVGDVTQRLPIKETFDAAVMLMSVQDIADYESAIKHAAKLLNPKGRLVIVMLHPAFRIPRQSGWGVDKNRKLQYRRIDSYLNELDVPMKEFPGQEAGTSRSFHRPLQSYFKAFKVANLAAVDIREVPAGKFRLKENQQIPLVMGIKAIKAPSN